MQAFNFSTADHHFKLLKSFIDKHSSPWENIYNIDEKGLQLGGRRKARGENFFFPQSEVMHSVAECKFATCDSD